MSRRLERAPDARAVAHEVLVRVETTEAFADVLLGHRLAAERLTPADRSLATRLVFGSLAWQGRLDHHLAPCLHMPVAALEPGVRAALRLGLYQLLFLDRVPAYAAVDASVRLAGRACGRGAAGLVNAVLRRAAAEEARATLPRPGSLERLAVEWSHPSWLVERWAREFGRDELPALLAANNRRAPTALRTNRLRTTPERLAEELAAAGVATRRGAWSPDALLVERGGARVRRLAAYRAGRLAFQGEASQLVALLLDPARGARVLDACAAPGGKAMHAACLTGPEGRVVALDPRHGGLRRAAAEAARLGVTGVLPVVGDARRPPVSRALDAVLVDAPCSGLGTLRRHPEVRWRRRPEDIPRLAAVQQEILHGVAPLVRPGGVLVYAVCTLAREENEQVVEKFQRAEPRFVVEDARAHLAASAAAAVTENGFLRTLPGRHGLDGFFAARLRAGS
jgi:16S rRNA (cytosine967-C5)-methyltransferase